MKDEVKIEARVQAFAPHAFVDHYHSGRTQTFGATQLEVLAPPDLGRKELTIYHEGEVPLASPWRRPGTLLLLHMQRGDVEDYGMLFAGAVRGLEVLREGGGR